MTWKTSIASGSDYKKHNAYMNPNNAMPANTEYKDYGTPRSLLGPISAKLTVEIAKHITNYNFLGTFLHKKGVLIVARKYGIDISIKQKPMYYLFTP